MPPSKQILLDNNKKKAFKTEVSKALVTRIGFKPITF